MPDWDRVHPDHVRAAIAECDRLGSREFLARYKFGRAPAYTLWHGGQEYDSKAILGVAYLHATGTAATSSEFSGGKDGAAGILERLGFDVVVDEQLLAQEPAPRAKASAAKAASTRTASTKAAAAKAPSTRSAAKKAPVAKRVSKPARPTMIQEAPPTICPNCFMAIPATGLCDNCD